MKDRMFIDIDGDRLFVQRSWARTATCPSYVRADRAGMHALAEEMRARGLETIYSPTQAPRQVRAMLRAVCDLAQGCNPAFVQWGEEGPAPTYAVVPGPGMHGENAVVEGVYLLCAEAEGKARALTAEYQRSLKRHGGTSGAYRVVDGEYMTAGLSRPGSMVDAMEGVYPSTARGAEGAV